MERSFLRENLEEKTWCELTIRLHEGKLSITGTYGEIRTRQEAKREALDAWIGYFEDCPSEMSALEIKLRLKNRFRNAREAAKFVLKTDGEFHGLDVLESKNQTNPDSIYLVFGGGQCREELAKWFPEVIPYFKWHLNDMHAGCEHQEALGWGRIDVEVQESDAWGRIRTKVYEDSINAPCPTCGYRYGSKWLRRELPDEVVKWAENFQG